NEKTLYVAATRGNCIWRANLLPDGTSLVRPGIFVQMSGGSGPDGMAVDQAGNLVVAHAGGGIVWVFSPLGQPIWRIDSCQHAHTTNVAYGGPQNRHLYITESESGCVLVTEMDIPGQPMHSHL
ncbi:MAG: SMP-30/gluconolactonase/LRE family protein, partial [Alcaligenaceae bacterium]